MRTPWTPLSRLMGADRSGKSAVARRFDGDYVWDDFQNHVASLCEQLATQPPGRWLLSAESSYAFSVGLFALWHTGRIAVLPPNHQVDSLRESAQGVQGLISDSATALFKLPVLSPLALAKKGVPWTSLDSSRVVLELFTSGSTGERQAVRKTLGQLERELAVLENTFGERLGDCEIHATVSHHHIYGLLFRLLWPLCAGRPFADQPFLLWEELTPRLAASGAACLVSSPAHLERLSAAGEEALRKKHPRAIFSSGGPLRDSAAERIRDVTGQPPIEVFGSTETGGVGWRCGESLWRPLDGVTVSAGAPLNVKSSFGPSDDWMVMGDRGSVFPDGRFSVEGRTDRIVKLAEKRISLDDMERRLHQHPSVAAARIFVLTSNEDENRMSLGAVVALNPDGRSQLAQSSRANLTIDLRAHLQKSFDASTLPRMFRFVDELPVDAMGKVSRAVLTALFQTSSATFLPQILQKSQDASCLSQRLRVPENLIYLEGHFPNYPIVPGVVQLQWVMDAVTPWLGRRPVVRRMEAVKFKAPLFPGHEFSLVVERTDTESELQLQFSLVNGDVHYSSGRLVLA